MEIKRGLSFQWASGGNGDHTWFVMTHLSTDKYIIANISSTDGKRFIDNTCLLTPAQCGYAKIVKESYVLYREAKLVSKDELFTILEDDSTTLNAQAPCWLVDTMASGFMKSTAASERIKNHYRTVFSSS